MSSEESMELLIKRAKVDSDSLSPPELEAAKQIAATARRPVAMYSRAEEVD